MWYNNYMKNTVRAFIGISKKCCTLILYKNGATLKKEDFFFQEKEARRLTLKLLIKSLNEVSKSSVLIFYSNDDLITFEWEKEYKKDKSFSTKTADLSLWNEIAKICDDKNITLTIKGEDSVLSSYAYYK